MIRDAVMRPAFLAKADGEMHVAGSVAQIEDCSGDKKLDSIYQLCEN